MCHFWIQNGPFVLNKSLFGTNHYYYFHIPIGPFNCAKKFLKILRQIQSYEDAPFLGCTIFPFAPIFFFFFGKVINIIFIYLLAPFIVQNFFKNVAADLELKGHRPKMAH